MMMFGSISDSNTVSSLDRVTWTLLRYLKTFFRIKGSQLLSVSEHKIRAKVNEDEDMYETGSVKFKPKGQPVKDVPFIRCLNVKTQLVIILKGHAAAGRLIQRSAIKPNP